MVLGWENSAVTAVEETELHNNFINVTNILCSLSIYKTSILAARVPYSESECQFSSLQTETFCAKAIETTTCLPFKLHNINYILSSVIRPKLGLIAQAVTDFCPNPQRVFMTQPKRLDFFSERGAL